MRGKTYRGWQKLAHAADEEGIELDGAVLGYGTLHDRLGSFNHADLIRLLLIQARNHCADMRICQKGEARDIRPASVACLHTAVVLGAVACPQNQAMEVIDKDVEITLAAVQVHPHLLRAPDLDKSSDRCSAANGPSLVQLIEHTAPRFRFLTPIRASRTEPHASAAS